MCARHDRRCGRRYGWWNRSSPVSTNRADVLATAYVRNGTSTLIAVASWCSDTSPANVTIAIDWAGLGLGNGRKVEAPGIASYNRRTKPQRFEVSSDDGSVTVPVPRLEGWLLVLS